MTPDGIYEQFTIHGTTEYVVHWPDGTFKIFDHYPDDKELEL